MPQVCGRSVARQAAARACYERSVKQGALARLSWHQAWVAHDSAAAGWQRGCAPAGAACVGMRLMLRRARGGRHVLQCSGFGAGEARNTAQRPLPRASARASQGAPPLLSLLPSLLLGGPLAAPPPPCSRHAAADAKLASV